MTGMEEGDTVMTIANPRCPKCNDTGQVTQWVQPPISVPLKVMNHD